jgi:hypothetical protein
LRREIVVEARGDLTLAAEYALALKVDVDALMQLD